MVREVGMYMKRGIVLGIVVLSLFTVVMPSSVVVAQENDLEIISATLHTEEIEEGEGYRLTFEYRSTAPRDSLEGVSIYADAREFRSTAVEAKAGERGSHSVWLSEPEDPGEYTITVGSPTGTEAGELVVAEEPSMSDGMFGAVGFYTGILLIGIGVLGAIGAISVEAIRSTKYHFGEGLNTSAKPAVALLGVGSVAILSGGLLAGDPWYKMTYIGSLLGLTVACCGGYYGIRYLWREL